VGWANPSEFLYLSGTQPIVPKAAQPRPRISCGFETTSALAQFFANAIPLVGVEAAGTFMGQADLESFLSMVNTTDETLTKGGQKCLDVDGAFLKYMGTVSPIISQGDIYYIPRHGS
jgi:hypothetical protein